MRERVGVYEEILLSTGKSGCGIYYINVDRFPGAEAISIIRTVCGRLDHCEDRQPTSEDK